MKIRVILFSLFLCANLYAQGTDGDLLLLFGGDRNVYAGDYDGSTEYLTKTSPVNLDLNGVNTITTLARNSTFEDNATDWATNGTHAVSVDGTSKLTGTYSGEIAASGVGDSTTNYASLATDKYTTIVSGTKYTLQVQVRAVLADTDVTLVIGGKAKVFTAVDQTSEILVYNFEATSGEVGQEIIIYLSQADDLYIDEVDLSEAYDFTYMAWVNTTASGTHKSILNSGAYNTSQPGFWLRSLSSEVGQLTLTGSNEISLSVSGFTIAGEWVLYTATVDRVGDMTFYENGVSKSTTSLATLGEARLVMNFSIGAMGYGGASYFEGYIGETQIVRGYALTAAEILANYNLGIKGKSMASSYLDGTIISWWKFAGTTDAIFLQDEQGNNDLTGTNMDQANDQVKLKKYAD